jgi:hypothetical protein
MTFLEVEVRSRWHPSHAVLGRSDAFQTELHHSAEAEVDCTGNEYELLATIRRRRRVEEDHTEARPIG